jgi:superfamily I DNA and/or RNA helicase
VVRRHRWKVGVVAQSHKVVENVLDGIVEQGLSAELVGKKPQDAAGDHLFTPLEQDGQRAFAEANEATGYVLGGTVWDLTNTKRIDRGQLDLLVIDEAGQFSLANTIAASVSAERLLLLGDPQQLPQVSQGTHPSPVDASALGHIIGDEHVLPADRGVFLAQSRRMHPAVTAPVSRLAYDGALHAHSTAGERRLEGVAPGLRAVPVVHVGNATASAEEASRVVEIVQGLLGAAWSSGPDAAPRPLTEHDVIVVTPYNAQAELVSTHLEAAGIRQVRVGTVDRFQGQEAAVAIVSLAASSAAEVPRGLSFLLSRNRLNVAISRAQWAAFLVYSPGLTDSLPTTPDGVAELSRFLTLVGD